MIGDTRSREAGEGAVEGEYRVLVRPDKNNSINADYAILPIPIWEVRMLLNALPLHNERSAS